MTISERNLGIIKTLQSRPMSGSLQDVLKHEGKTDGMGYLVMMTKPGRGFSCREWSKKQMENGTWVLCETYYPGPFDALAGLPSDLVSEYAVGISWEKFTEREGEFNTPYGVSLPDGAIRWADAAGDGPRYWYAVFEDVELAEAFASVFTTPDAPTERPGVEYIDV